MNCDRFREMLLDYIDGTLTGRDKAEFDAHVSSCPECRELVKSFGKLSESITDHLNVKASKIELPAYLWGKILSKVQKQKKASRFPALLKVGLTFASVIAVVAAGVFTPVFGKEGNLLNFISSKVIEGAANDYEQIFTPDLKGQVLKAYAAEKISVEGSITQDTIWKMKSEGFSPKEIAIATFISKKSGRDLDAVIAERLEGIGWGRIANRSGISVFSVKEMIAQPIEIATQEMSGSTKIDLQVSVSSVEDGKLMVDSISEPVEFAGVPVFDSNNKPVDLSKVDANGLMMSFDIENGGLKLSSVKLENGVANDQSKFDFNGKIVSFDGQNLVLATDQGNKEVSTVAGETVMHSIAQAGSQVRISGYMVGKRFLASSISKPRLRKMLGNPGNNNQQNKTENQTGTGNDQSGTTNQTPKRNGQGNGNGKRQNGSSSGNNSNNTNQNQSNNNQSRNTEQNNNQNNEGNSKNNWIALSEKFLDTYFANFDDQSNLTTKHGSYKTANTTVYIEFGTDVEPVSLSILSYLAPDTAISLSGKDKAVAIISIDKKVFTEIDGWIVNRDGNQCALLSKTDSGFVKKVLVIPDWIQSDDLRVANRIENALFSSNAIVWKGNVTANRPRKQEGKIDSVTPKQIQVKGLTIQIIDGVTKFRNPKGLLDAMPKNAKTGSPVAVDYVMIDNKPVAFSIMFMPTDKAPGGPPPGGDGQGQPPPDGEQPPIKVDSVSTRGANNIELKLENGDTICINPKTTKIFIVDLNGQKNPATIDDVKQGAMISFRLSGKGQMAVEVTVHQ